jgi:hypothetical protein
MSVCSVTLDAHRVTTNTIRVQDSTRIDTNVDLVVLCPVEALGLCGTLGDVVDKSI